MAPQVAPAAQVVEDRERRIINYAKSPDFNRAGLEELFGFARPGPSETP